MFNDAYVVGNDTNPAALCLNEADKDSGCEGFWVAESGGGLRRNHYRGGG